jgi:hypothetical protein
MKRLLLIVVLLCSCEVHAQITKAWAVDGSTYIKKDGRDSPARDNDSNLVWSDGTVHVFCGKNDEANFQLVLEAGALAVDSVNVKLSFLTDGTNTIQNTSTDATVFAGRDIELYLEHHIYAIHRSDVYNIHWGAKAYQDIDALYEGWVPNHLVPMETPRKLVPNALGYADTAQGGSGGLTGPGFKVFANKNAVIWFNIRVDKSKTSSTYFGTIKVWKTNTGDTLYSIPVELKVYSYALSDTTHFMTFMHYHPTLLANYTGTTYGSAAYLEWVKKIHFLGHRNRIDMITRDTYDDLKAYRMGYYSGTKFSMGDYEGPGVGVGQNMYIAALWNVNFSQWPTPGFKPEVAGSKYNHSQAGWRSLADDFEQLFLDSAAHAIRAVELIDEPNSDLQRTANNEVADWIRTGTGVGKNIYLFIPEEWMEPMVTNHSPAIGWSTGINMWAMHPFGGPTLNNGMHSDRYAGRTYMTVEELREKMSGDTKPGLVGTYNGWNGAMPVVQGHMTPLVQSRLLPWVMWEYNVDFYWHWTGTTWMEYGGMNAWAGEMVPGYSFDDGGGGLYLGVDNVITSESRGINAPILGITIKEMAIGLRDYEMLYECQRNGVLDTNWVNNVGIWAAWDDFRYPQHQWKETPSWTTRGWIVEGQRQLMADALGTVGIPTAPPAIPTLLTIAGITRTSFTFGWNQSSGATSYRVDVSTSPSFASYVSGYQNKTVSGLSTAVTGLSRGVTYYCRVRAYNSDGTSASSYVHSTKTLTPLCGYR